MAYIPEDLRNTSMGPKIPTSTYRLQLNKGFKFCDAKALIGYFKMLGIKDIYASPILKAKKGSKHGYDIVDYSLLNPEIGTEEELGELADALKQNEMGLILDIVPNHMCINDEENRWWWSLLENGRNSPFASYFDIDWSPPKIELVNKVLLPVLEEPFGLAIDHNKVQIELLDGSFVFKCPMTLPVNPKTWNIILEPVIENTGRTLGEEDRHIIELKSILYEVKHLPGTNETEPKLIEERQIEKEIIKKRLSSLLKESDTIRKELESVLEEINGGSGDFSFLEAILKDQPYRLSYWRVANEEINYRRFFDVNELAGVRTEIPEVFFATHEVVLKLISKGWITGFRIDHVDGLLDPEQYFIDLQNACHDSLPQEKGKKSSLETPFYLVIEKILSGSEALSTNWKVHGTTGYDFLNLLNGIFVKTEAFDQIHSFYRRFTEDYEKISSTIYGAKKFILFIGMPAELHVLARHLDKISEQHRWSRDFTRETLLTALRNVIASFPVYRSYIRTESKTFHETDKQYVRTAIRNAKKFNPAMSPSVFDFIQSVLLLEHPPELKAEQIKVRENFVMRFQQMTGPVMAKGLEDTAFYRTYPLLSLNEVGGSPGNFGTSVEKFHDENSARQQRFPHALLATSTHDTKRSEDVRARINVLSELPQAWEEAVLRWNFLNAHAKEECDDEIVPGHHVEYLIYQTLIGSWPTELKILPFDPTIFKSYVERLAANIQKAQKEAKINTSWVNPNEAYESSLDHFLKAILNPDLSFKFLEDFLKFIPKIIRCGMYNSLSQVLLKTTSPGVPDFYQGCELWNYTMVDPDNRRGVDFNLRKKLLQEVVSASKDPIPFLNNALSYPDDSKSKLYITWKTLQFRNQNAALFANGNYGPINIQGEKAHHVIAFSRSLGSDSAISIAGRFFSDLEDSLTMPIGVQWEGTFAYIPKGNYIEVFTGKEISTVNGELPLRELFSNLPLALLKKSKAKVLCNTQV